MPLVAIESPLKANQGYSREQFRRYWQLCLEDAIKYRKEDVYSSHWLADVLDDDNPLERAIGLKIGLTWSSFCDYAAVYTDFGISEGMSEAMQFYDKIGKRVEWRSLRDRDQAEGTNYGERMLKMIRDMDELASDSAEYNEPDLTDFS
jgi:hypothetical protein